jgi:hypothetical protein
MATGNVEGKLVHRDFWPACENCKFFAACQVRSRHPAYPHTWHWGREFVSFPEGDLIVKSWVGTSAIGQSHTGCHSYEVAPQFSTEPQTHHHRYLRLEYERQQLDARLRQFEQGGTLSETAVQVYNGLSHRFLAITHEQQALRGGLTAAQSVVA